MNVTYYLKDIDGLTIPEQANSTDAGYDIIATTSPRFVGIPGCEGSWISIDYIEYETNLYFVPEVHKEYGATIFDSVSYTNFHTDLRPRSSISKYNLVLCNSVGLVDRGYHNQVLVRFKYIMQPMDIWYPKQEQFLVIPNMNKIYQRGDRICQMLARETHEITFDRVKELPGVNRGGGFGTTELKKAA